MRIRNITIMGVLCLLLTSFASSQEVVSNENDSSFELVVFPAQFFENKEQQAGEHHYFGGQTIYLPFVTNGSKPSVLKVELVQKAFSLTAQYETNAQVDLDANQIVIDLPIVKREVVFEMIIKQQDMTEKSWMDVVRVDIHVYPNDILKPMQEWAKEVQLRIKDREGVLTQVLEEKEIEYVDYRAAYPKKEDIKAVTIVVGDPDEKFLEEKTWHATESLIILRNKEGGLPKVLVRPIKTGMLIDSSVPTVGKLKNNPRNQKMLLETIRLSNTLN